MVLHEEMDQYCHYPKFDAIYHYYCGTIFKIINRKQQQQEAERNTLDLILTLTTISQTVLDLMSIQTSQVLILLPITNQGMMSIPTSWVLIPLPITNQSMISCSWKFWVQACSRFHGATFQQKGTPWLTALDLTIKKKGWGWGRCTSTVQYLYNITFFFFSNNTNMIPLVNFRAKGCGYTKYPCAFYILCRMH